MLGDLDYCFALVARGPYRHSVQIRLVALLRPLT